MYLVKELSYHHGEKQRIINNGIDFLIAPHINQILVKNEVWGCTEVHIDDLADMSQLQKDEAEYQLAYVNEYFVKHIGDGFKKFIFNVSEYEPDNVEGYIIFLCNNVGKVKTNGEVLFGRYFNESVAVLREGQYFEYDGGRAKVINGKLMHVI